MSSSIIYSEKNCSIDFLSQEFNEDTWKEKYQGKLKLIRQTHGINIVTFPSNETSPEGDASVTESNDIVLGIRTADCLPILIYDHINQRIAAVHAGWNGVATNILPHTVKRLLDMGSKVQNLHLWIGPHIKKASFEIEAPVKEEILLSICHLPLFKKEDFCVQTSLSKFNLCLQSVVRFQLKPYGIQSNQFTVSDVDTKTDSNWASYRRDKTTKRNLSCIYLRS